MESEAKNRQIANSYYNLGLEKARIRDLSGAAQCLKKILHFCKYQIEARNLLGLIYYENGEVADALVQWVISMSLQPENNLADHYLERIQRKPGQLEAESQAVKTFNQALWHAQNGSDDLAALQLARVVSAKPHFVKAHLLLALLYMRREDYNKAGRSLYKILQIDKSNSKALYYMSIVKQNTGRAEAEKRRMVKAFSHRQMEDDDVIIPNTYKESTGLSTVFHIILGLIFGLVAFYVLVLPAVENRLNRQRDDELMVYMQKLNSANQENDILAQEMIKREKEGRGFTFFHFMVDLTGGPCVYKRLSGCGSGTEYLAVTPWGDLYPCHQFVGEEEFLMGNVDEGIQRPEIQDTFKNCNVYAKKDCKECFARFYCSGGCAANSYNFHGKINDVYEIGCKMQRKRIECALMIKAALAKESEG